MSGAKGPGLVPNTGLLRMAHPPSKLKGDRRLHARGLALEHPRPITTAGKFQLDE